MRNRHMRKPAELLLVPMIDIFTVLVTFLLMTAVFSRITVVELDLPSAADGPAVTEPPFRLEVILREEGFELYERQLRDRGRPEGRRQIRPEGAVRAGAVAQARPSGRRRFGAARPQVAYDDLIQVMDAIRSAEGSAVGATTLADRRADGTHPEIAQPGDPRPERVALYRHSARRRTMSLWNRNRGTRDHHLHQREDARLN